MVSKLDRVKQIYEKQKQNEVLLSSSDESSGMKGAKKKETN